MRALRQWVEILAAAEQRRMRCIDDRIDGQDGDVALDDSKNRGHGKHVLRDHRRTAAAQQLSRRSAHRTESSTA